MSGLKRLIPLMDRVLVEKLAAPTKTSSGVLLPESATAGKLAEGRVIATGTGRRSALSGEVVPVSVKEGDTVLLPEYGGQTIKLNNQEYILYRDDELLGVLTD